MLLIPKASGIKSKHITDIIRPDANDNIKLKNLFEFFLITIPSIPPIVVPNVPKNKPSNVVFKISFTAISPFYNITRFICFICCFMIYFFNL